MSLLPFAQNNFVPARFARGVPACDASLITLESSEPLQIHLPPYTPPGSSMADRRRSAYHLVFHHELYAILPDGIKIGPLAPAIWDTAATSEQQARALWQSSMWDAGYVQHEVSTEDYYRMVGSRSLFGQQCNPIASVVHLAMNLGVHDVLYHHVMAVALQFYLIVHGSFMRRRTDAAWQFDESLPPCVFQMFHASDWSIDGRIEAPDLTDSNLEELARTQHFPAFLDRVLAWVVTHAFPEAGHLIHECRKFVTDKLQKNFMQALTCMRFRELQPQNLVARLVEAGHPNACMRPIKFFAHPKVCRMQSLHGVQTGAARTPQFFTHVFFSPTAPLVFDELQASDAQRRLIWRLALYYPLLIFKQKVLVAAKQMLQEDGLQVMPQTAQDKYQQYDGVVELPPTRARYCVFFRDQAYAYVPNMLLPDSVLAYDEADVRHMSQDAWNWCAERGRTMAEPACLTLPVDSDDALLAHEFLRITPDTVDGNKAWPLFWAISRLIECEEYAVWCLVHHYSLSLWQVQTSYAAFHTESTAIAHEAVSACPNLRAQLAEWDRCSCKPDCPPNLIRVWRILFPISVITHGPVPWIQAWQPVQSVRRFRNCMKIIRAMMAHADVRRDLNVLQQMPVDSVPRDLDVDFRLAMQIDSSSTLKQAMLLAPSAFV